VGRGSSPAALAVAITGQIPLDNTSGPGAVLPGSAKVLVANRDAPDANAADEGRVLLPPAGDDARDLGLLAVNLEGQRTNEGRRGSTPVEGQ
jgi:hypothetical protein